jgi:thiamine-phosphate diphosphorylase
MSTLTLQFPLLCLITASERPDLHEAVEQALAAGVSMLQLRGPQLTAARLYELAQTLGPLCRQRGAAFLVNDRLDVGLACGADGFQLGRHSLPLRAARTLVGANALLGASVHTLIEAQAAIANGADFLIAGTIFPSSSHPGTAGSGPGLISTIKQALPTCPVLAIGGITSANAAEVMAAGADGIAVISAIFGATNISQAVQNLCMAMGKGK